jgi:hypothetical protein
MKRTTQLPTTDLAERIDQEHAAATRNQWASRINAEWRKSVVAIIETGRLLIEAKDALGRGEWGNLFSSRGFDGLVPFTIRTAQMLMVIAEHPILTNAKFISHLPPSWGTLYELACMPDDELLSELEHGGIHPAMTRKDVKNLPGPKIGRFLKGLADLMHFYQAYKGRPDIVARLIRYAPEVRGLMSRFGHRELQAELPEYVRQMLQELEQFYRED